jgi:hypothetical protein
LQEGDVELQKGRRRTGGKEGTTKRMKGRKVVSTRDKEKSKERKMNINRERSTVYVYMYLCIYAYA